MTPFILQKTLKTEMENLFQDFILKGVDGEPSRLNVYRQNLPIKSGRDDKDHYPHLRIIILDGEDGGFLEPNQCRILLVAGVWDDNEDRQGFDDLLNVTQKVYKHLITTAFDQFELEYPIKWKIHEEDTFPFYFAGIETVWTVGKITPPDSDLV